MIVSFFTFQQIFAQDTLLVEKGVNGINLELKEIIQGDTTASGERINPSRVYKLERGG